MKLIAYARLLSRKINLAHLKAKNPFTDGELMHNPFNRSIYSTLVWVEPDENFPERFNHKDY